MRPAPTAAQTVEELPMNEATPNRLAVVQRVARRELEQAEAAAILGLSVRQVRRIALRYRLQGPEGLVHRLQGRPANNRTPEETIRRAMLLLTTRYAKLGPRSASRRLAEDEGIVISRETLRCSMIEAGLWEPSRGRVQPEPGWQTRTPAPEPDSFWAWSSP